MLIIILENMSFEMKFQMWVREEPGSFIPVNHHYKRIQAAVIALSQWQFFQYLAPICPVNISQPSQLQYFTSNEERSAENYYIVKPTPGSSDFVHITGEV